VKRSATQILHGVGLLALTALHSCTLKSPHVAGRIRRMYIVLLVHPCKAGLSDKPWFDTPW